MKLLELMQHFEKQISEYAYRTGKTNAEAIASLLDYIISYFDVDVLIGKKSAPQDKELRNLMSEYFLCQERMLRHNDWFDVWGVLFEKLVTNGAKGQFFTPPSLCDMMAQMQISKDLPKTHSTPFGKRATINDCACGSGRTLLSAHCQFMPKEGNNTQSWKPYLYADDVDGMCCKMCAVNFMVHGCFGEVRLHNTLSEPNTYHIRYIINEAMHPFPSGVPSIRMEFAKR